MHQDLAAQDRIFGLLRRLAEHAGHALVGAEPAPDLHQSPARLGVARFERNQPRERVERTLVVVQAVVSKMGNPAQ
jgi:hypothetical protein